MRALLVWVLDVEHTQSTGQGVRSTVVRVVLCLLISTEQPIKIGNGQYDLIDRQGSSIPSLGVSQGIS